MSSIFNNDIPGIIDYFKNATGINFSESFLICADKQLVEDLEGRLGIKYNRRIQFSSPSIYETKVLEIGEVSKFCTRLYVNHNWNPITVAWKSKSGVVYEPWSDNVDCNDIVFWFDEIDPVLMQKQLFPVIKLPFKTNKFNFELAVTSLNVDTVITLTLHESNTGNDSLGSSISSFVNEYNIQSENANIFRCVIHNMRFEHQPNSLILYMDMGSVGFHFLKELLSFLSKTNLLKKVEIA